MKTLTALKAIRVNCLGCCDGSPKMVAYCTCDGTHSTRCELWPFRFGFRPANVQPQRFVTPGALPGPNVPVDELPTPKITSKSDRKMTSEQRQAAAERLRRARKQKAAVA